MSRFRHLPLLLALVATPAFSDPPISVSAWSRATAAGGTTGVVYATILDHGAPDRLIGASSPVAAKVELHDSEMTGMVMRMQPIAALPIPGDTAVTLAPGGRHLMLIGLHHQLRKGERFPITLTFEHAGPVTTTAIVAGPGDASAPR